MPVLAIHLPVSDETMRALCWTLIHSLWEGALLALLAAAVLFFARTRSAALRYNLLVLLLVLFAGSVCFTFCQLWKPEIKTQVATLVTTPDSSPLQEETAAVARPGAGSFAQYSDAFAGFCNTHAPTIVALWWLVFLIKCLRMALELRLIRGFRRRGTVVPASVWLHKMQELATRLQIRRPVTLLESARVQVPATIGFLKPVILVPLGLLAQLPAEQVEAILLHELAHIRRRDFLVNLLQHFMETLFFFNPAVLWVSALLRDEREHCCDDIAVAALNNKSGYLNALLSFEQFRANTAPYAPAFPGRKGQLLYRVKRLIGQNNTKIFSNMEKITLIITVLFIGTIAFLPTTPVRAQVVKTRQNTTIRTIDVNGDGTATDPQRMTIRDSDGKTYILNRVGKNISDMQVDGQKIPSDQWANYNWLVKTVDEQIEIDMAQAKRDAEQAQRDRQQAERDAQQAMKDKAQAERDAEQAQQDQQQAARDAEQAQLDKAQAERDAEQAQRDKAQAKLDAEQAKRDVAQAKLDAEQAKRDAAQAKLDTEQAKRDAAQAKLDTEQAKRDAQQAKLDAAQAKRDAEQAKKDREMVERLVGDLVSDRIVPDKERLKSFELSERGLQVNGQKQPEETFKRYKAKYLKTQGASINYGIRGSQGGGIFINDGN